MNIPSTKTLQIPSNLRTSNDIANTVKWQLPAPKWQGTWREQDIQKKHLQTNKINKQFRGHLPATRFDKWWACNQETLWSSHFFSKTTTELWRQGGDSTEPLPGQSARGLRELPWWVTHRKWWVIVVFSCTYLLCLAVPQLHLVTAADHLLHPMEAARLDFRLPWEVWRRGSSAKSVGSPGSFTRHSSLVDVFGCWCRRGPLGCWKKLAMLDIEFPYDFSSCAELNCEIVLRPCWLPCGFQVARDMQRRLLLRLQLVGYAHSCQMHLTPWSLTCSAMKLSIWSVFNLYIVRYLGTDGLNYCVTVIVISRSRFLLKISKDSNLEAGMRLARGRTSFSVPFASWLTTRWWMHWG